MKLNYICKHGHLVEGENALAQMRNGKLVYWACRQCHRIQARNSFRRLHATTIKRQDSLQQISFERWTEKRRAVWEDRILALSKSSIGNGAEKG